jgi:hypothetical protein
MRAQAISVSAQACSGKKNLKPVYGGRYWTLLCCNNVLINLLRLVMILESRIFYDTSDF